jgi:hypothetical protein
MNKNKHHYTNGVTNIISSECPPGFWKGISGKFHKTKGSLGMKWYNNGKEQKLGYEKPEGEEWVYGKLKKKNNMGKNEEYHQNLKNTIKWRVEHDN